MQLFIFAICWLFAHLAHIVTDMWKRCNLTPLIFSQVPEPEEKKASVKKALDSGEDKEKGATGKIGESVNSYSQE